MSGWACVSRGKTRTSVPLQRCVWPARPLQRPSRWRSHHRNSSLTGLGLCNKERDLSAEPHAKLQQKGRSGSLRRSRAPCAGGQQGGHGGQPATRLREHHVQGREAPTCTRALKSVRHVGITLMARYSIPILCVGLTARYFNIAFKSQIADGQREGASRAPGRGPPPRGPRWPSCWPGARRRGPGPRRGAAPPP